MAGHYTISIRDCAKAERALAAVYPAFTDPETLIELFPIEVEGAGMVRFLNADPGREAFNYQMFPER